MDQSILPTEDLLARTGRFRVAEDPDTDYAATVGEVLADVERQIMVNPGRAEELLVQLRALAPESLHIKMLLAGLYCEHRQWALALPLLAEVLAQLPDFLPALTRRASACYHLDRVSEAIELAERVVELDPADGGQYNNLGLYRMAAGDFDKAAEAFAAAIALAPESAHAYHNLLQLPGQALDASQLARLRALADPARPADADRALANFCISRHYRARDDIDAEFEYLRRAKSQLAEQDPWDVADAERLVAELLALPGELLHGFARLRETAVEPLFICSLPRAGSTLLEQLLASHPEIGSIGEAGLGTRAAQAAMADRGLDEPHWWRWLIRADAPAIVDSARVAFDRAIAALRPASALVCEKSVNNDLMLGLCLLAFPAAPVIWLRRDPMDLCLSAYQAWLPDLRFNNRLAWLAARYRQHVSLMRRWQALFPGRIAEVRYEDLVLDPGPVLAGLAAGIEIGANFSTAPGERRYAVRTASNWQARQPIYRSSLHRWRKYARHLAEIADLDDGPVAT